MSKKFFKLCTCLHVYIFLYSYTDDMMPKLEPKLISREQLAKVSLIIAVVDYDMANEDDLIGTVIIPFSEIMVR